MPGRALAALQVAVLLTAGLGACGRPAPPASTPPDDGARIIAGVIGEQESRVADARAAAARAEDAARAARIRQAALDAYGRSDLAATLDLDASYRETEARHARRRLAEEQEALNAYRAYALTQAQEVSGRGGASQASAAAAPGARSGSVRERPGSRR